MNRKLILRDLDRGSAQSWRQVLALLEEMATPGARLAVINIKRNLRRKKLAPLIRNGSKP